jgi:hypothetical protein
MSMVHECGREDCAVLTMGELCLEHERELATRLDLTLLARAVEETEDATPS